MVAATDQDFEKESHPRRCLIWQRRLPDFCPLPLFSRITLAPTCPLQTFEWASCKWAARAVSNMKELPGSRIVMRNSMLAFPPTPLDPHLPTAEAMSVFGAPFGPASGRPQQMTGLRAEVTDSHSVHGARPGAHRHTAMIRVRRRHLFLGERRWGVGCWLRHWLGGSSSGFTEADRQRRSCRLAGRNETRVGGEHGYWRIMGQVSAAGIDSGRSDHTGVRAGFSSGISPCTEVRVSLDTPRCPERTCGSRFRVS